VTIRQAHRFQAGQSIAYTEDGTPDVPRGGFEIIGLSYPGTHEPGYVIRTAQESSVGSCKSTTPNRT
jgi:hypothetical protein